MKITLSLDPGQTGAACIFEDERPAAFIDMPVMDRATKGVEIDCKQLGALIRGLFNKYPGAHFMAVMERVNAMPAMDAQGNAFRIGATAHMNFGEAVGALKGVLGALNIDWIMVDPRTWKKFFALKSKKDGGVKDDARILVLKMFPHLEPVLARKKDGGRADALLIGWWALKNGKL